MGDESFFAVLGQVASRARDILGPHPDPVALAAYADGRLDHEAVEQIRDHLSLCHQCVRWYMELHRYLDDRQHLRESMPPEQLEADWLEVRRRVLRAGLIHEQGSSFR
jgi:predicted anti-sigma-YlaC factor YlaD